MGEDTNTVTIRIHLGSGTVIDIPYPTEDEPEEVAENLGAQINTQRDERTGRPVPYWLQIDSTLIFTGAVSAIEAL